MPCLIVPSTQQTQQAKKFFKMFSESYESSELEFASGQVPTTAVFRRAKVIPIQSANSMCQMKGLVQDVVAADRVSIAQLMPVDLTAQLFHVLLKDERISSAFRVWIARLQWPVLRLATLDPMGFQQETHPAYQWLFKVSSCILQPGDHIRPCGVFEEEIKRLILVIESFPVADAQVFEWAYSEFIQFLKKIHGEHPQDAITGCVACQQVQQEALAAQYRIAILDKLSHEPVEVEIRNFLSEIWPHILAAQAVNKGLEHPETLKLKHTAIELIRLNTALLRVHERKHAMAKVPKMIDTLRHGMQLLGLPLLEQDAHIQKIGANLSDAYMKKHSPQTAGIFNSERRTIQRGKKGVSHPVHKEENVDGLQVIDDNSDIAWRMWERALVEQQSKRNSAAE